jgi:ribonuclease R
MADRNKNELKKTIIQHISGSRKGASADRLAALLRIKKRERARFLLALAGMERDGDVIRDKKGRYTAPGTDYVSARLMSLQRGYGFARLENGEGDIFIHGHDLKAVLPGDTLLVKIEEGDLRGPQGSVIQVLEKGSGLYTGRLTEDKDGRPIVVPDAFIRYVLPVKNHRELAAKKGDKVRFEAEYGRSGELFARVVTTYGNADSAKICADAIVDSAGIPTEFSEDAIEQAQKLALAGITQKELDGREDLRDRMIFTIDGADAKDLDDAVSLEETGNGWILGVHIADVSHYVKENTPLDKQARLRGTSVYFADRVIPMLPEELSNGICSLNAGEDRLTLSAILTLNKMGICKDVQIRKSVIRSRVRGVYSEVNMLFDGNADPDIQSKYADVRPTLDSMRELAALLRKNAAERGTMDLISTESVFVLDEQGHPVDIQGRTTGESEGMIEQFMIAANVAVASFARKRGIPFVYRIHEQPDSEKLEQLSETAKRLSLKQYKLDKPMDLKRLMDEARETKYARLISDRLLRSMAKARYSESPKGHYGLSLDDYCHFTSPIRRYPDLSIHRILSDALAGIDRVELVRRYTAFVRESSELSSQHEVRAMNAERDCESCYKAEYMSRFIGEEFDGVISSISAYGVYVELPNSVEGMIRLESLPESGLRYDEVASLLDRNNRPVYTVGDAMKIRVVGTDVSSGLIDFEPVLKTLPQ